MSNEQGKMWLKTMAESSQVARFRNMMKHPFTAGSKHRPQSAVQRPSSVGGRGRPSSALPTTGTRPRDTVFSRLSENQLSGHAMRTPGWPRPGRPPWASPERPGRRVEPANVSGPSAHQVSHLQMERKTRHLARHYPRMQASSSSTGIGGGGTVIGGGPLPRTAAALPPSRSSSSLLHKHTSSVDLTVHTAYTDVAAATPSSRAGLSADMPFGLSETLAKATRKTFGRARPESALPTAAICPHRSVERRQQYLLRQQMREWETDRRFRPSCQPPSPAETRAAREAVLAARPAFTEKEIAMKLASLELQLKYIDRREARLGMSEDVTAGDAEGEAVRKRKLSLQRKTVLRAKANLDRAMDAAREWMRNSTTMVYEDEEEEEEEVDNAPKLSPPAVGGDGDNAATAARVVKLHFRCEKLKSHDYLSKSDPFVVLFVDGCEVGRTEILKNKASADFHTLISCTYNPLEEQKARIEVRDDDGGQGRKFDPIGVAVETTVAELMASHDFVLANAKGKFEGKLFVTSIQEAAAAASPVKANPKRKWKLVRNAVAFGATSDKDGRTVQNILEEAKLPMRNSHDGRERLSRLRGEEMKLLHGRLQESEIGSPVSIITQSGKDRVKTVLNQLEHAVEHLATIEDVEHQVEDNLKRTKDGITDSSMGHKRLVSLRYFRRSSAHAVGEDGLDMLAAQFALLDHQLEQLEEETETLANEESKTREKKTHSSLNNAKRTWAQSSLDELFEVQPEAEAPCYAILLFAAAAQHQQKALAWMLDTVGVRLDLEDPTAEAGSKITVAHLAAMSGNIGTLNILVKLGHSHLFEIEDDEGLTPVVHATFGGHTDILRLFVSQGIDIAKVTGPEGRNLALVAAAHGQVDRGMWDLFREIGIDIFAMDTAGRGIGQLISANGHNKLFEEELGDFGLVEGNFTRRASLVDGVEIIGRTPSGNEYFNDWE